ncbi:hypothetical protein N7474_004838 [Penicillium riverlandense]|uniref:uncharacterized protein n=1 Tax=Penicillium riverlandense TaxID=1903569 RepID=UPI002546CA87|nr:uncharacterized protein N7474_004838 [Penicillium riverlandense]KAJ5819247.1 hypothetical protein N7474_004838 [Penicillium riverlandense]
MPRHLRRHSRDTIQNNGQGTQLPSHFQTPPSRHTPSNPTHRYVPTTAGPQALVTPDTVPVAAGDPAARVNPFTVFGPSGSDPNAQEMMDDEDEFDDDYHPQASAMGMDAPLDPEDEEDDDDIDDSEEIDGEEVEDMTADQLDGEDEDADEEMHDRETSPSPLPPNLREISSLASWTVSTSKPGCGVAALRHPSPSQYWQSDGPQPHTLTLHFFKLVAVVRIRVYLDFEMDESYTPTKMVFLAGMGGNDLVEFATWEGDTPCGWVDVPLEGVGGRNGGWVRNDVAVRPRHRAKSSRRTVASHRHNGDENDVGETGANDAENGDHFDDDEDEDHRQDIYAGNVLKAMVIQMRVVENHQNGKDTHVRGFQVFSCDDSRRRMAAAPSASADDRHRQHKVRHSLRAGVQGVLGHDSLGNEDVEAGRLSLTSGLSEPDWMGEPVIR